MDAIQPGLTEECSETVIEQLTAVAIGSGSIAVYATPAMIALMERAAVMALDHRLNEGLTSVGVAVEIRHLNATPIGRHVTAKAEIIEVDGRRVTFKLTAWDDANVVGEGTHVRVIVDQDRFMRRAQ